MTKSMILRSLCYLALPESFKSKFGINSKRKERLKIFPEPNVEIIEGDGETKIIYTWKDVELEHYQKQVNP